MSVFSLFLVWTYTKSEDFATDQGGNKIPDDRPHTLKGSLPYGPPAHPGNTEDPSTHAEMKRLAEVWRSCTSDVVEAVDTFLFVFLPFKVTPRSRAALKKGMSL